MSANLYPGQKVSLLPTVTCLMAIREVGGFPLSWQRRSTVSDSLIPSFGDSTHILTAVEGSGGQPAAQQEAANVSARSSKWRSRRGDSQ